LNKELTVHPGVIFSREHSLAAGVRMAFDVNAASGGCVTAVIVAAHVGIGF
jgi:hypothetical protein